MNLPNKLTLLRLALVPVMVVFFYIGTTVFAYLTVAVFLIASFTDFLDGHIARKQNIVTNFGKFMDPLADKALVLVALIVIVDKQIITLPILGAVCLSIMLLRELIVSGLRLVAAEKGRVIAADKLGKLKTVIQIVAITFLLLVPAFEAELAAYTMAIGTGFLAFASIISLISGASYVIKNYDIFFSNTERKG